VFNVQGALLSFWQCGNSRGHLPGCYSLQQGTKPIVELHYLNPLTELKLLLVLQKERKKRKEKKRKEKKRKEKKRKEKKEKKKTK
jgi:hypothetical protein